MRHLPLLLASVLTLGVAGAPVANGSPIAPAAVGSTTATQGEAARVRVRGTFNVATFNVLGNDHTNGKHDRFRSGRSRMRLTVRALRIHHVHVVALQEFEQEQQRAFRKRAGGYRVWADDNNDTNAVAWRTSKFKFLRGRTIGIPYFRGKVKQMPVVFLRQRSSGQQFAFTSFHNPATTKRYRGSAKWRKKATTREIKLAKNLRRKGTPTFLMGDFNDRTERWQCRVARGANMVTAGNGSRRGGSCKPLDRMRIDWIFGSNGTRFSHYKDVESRRVKRASDHPLIVVRVR